MRNINREKISIPVELTSGVCHNHLTNVIAAPTQVKISKDLYKGKKVNADGSIEFTVRDALRNFYKNKCAYCEKQCYKPKIDHHRPKGRVVGEGNANNGYYWLCYEWSNLLPSCTDCNSIESKGSKYPVLGNRNTSHPTVGHPPLTRHIYFLYESPYNTTEQPLLLHPEYCNPENNLDFDKHGKILGTTPKGLETVQVLKLDNEDLNGWRRKIYKDHLANLESIVRKYFRNIDPITENQFEDFISEWVLNLVVEANNENLEYTLFRLFLLKKIDYFFISELDAGFRNVTKTKITQSLLIIAQ